MMASKPVQHVPPVSVGSLPASASAGRHKRKLQEMAEMPGLISLAPIEHGKFRLSTTGLTVIGAPSFGEWEEVGSVLAVFTLGLAFIVGDWIRFGEAHFGEMAAQVIDARAWAPETVRNYIWLAEKVPLENRMLAQGLGVKHHQAVAALPPEQQRDWLKKALGDGTEAPWPAHKLTAAIRETMNEAPVTGWYILVTCTSEKQRTQLTKTIELEGATCRSIDKRVTS